MSNMVAKKETRMYKSQLNIFRVIKRLEALNGRTYTDQQIATATGLHRHTISTMRKGKAEPTLDKLLEFFRREGMPITVADLFVVEDDKG